MECTPCCSMAVSWNGRDSQSVYSVTEGSRRVEQQPASFPRCFASGRILASRYPFLVKTVTDILRLYHSSLLLRHEAKHSVGHMPSCQDRQALPGGGTGCTTSSCDCAARCRCLERRIGTCRVMPSGEAQCASTSSLGPYAPAQCSS